MRIRITYINHPCRFAIWSGKWVGYLHIYSNLSIEPFITADLCYSKWLTTIHTLWCSRGKSHYYIAISECVKY